LVRILLTSCVSGAIVFLAQKDISYKEIFRSSKPGNKPAIKQIESILLPDTIMFQQNPKNVFLDVREKKFYDYAHISGAINLPYEDIAKGKIPEEVLEKIKSAPNSIIYCTSNSCGISYHAARILIDKGLNVKVYSEGWGQWKACNLPTEKSIPPENKDNQ
ncbi:MAG: rhodanese-like domain-containing protein, partial [Lentisphaerota bacterium]